MNALSTPVHSVVDFDMPHQFIPLGHSELAYWKVGSGPDLLLVHGFPLHSATYRNLLPVLSQCFTCHLMDHPGAGKSRIIHRKAFSFEANADDLIKAMRQLGVSTYGIVAHDSGGAIARHIAASKQDSIFGLILSGTEIPQHRSFLFWTLLLMGKIPGGFNGFVHGLRIGLVRRSHFAFGATFNDTAKIEGEFFELFIRPLIESASLRQNHVDMLSTLDTSKIDELAILHPKITAPVQCIWGKHDPYFPLHALKKMTTQFSTPVDIKVFEEGKLFVHEEYPVEFAQHAVEFLQHCLSTQKRLRPEQYVQA